MQKTPVVKSSAIADFLGAKLFGKNIAIEKITPINMLEKNSLSFARKFDDDYVKAINSCPVSLIICADEYKDKLKSAYIISDNPGLDFLRTVNKFFVPPAKIGIDKTAKVDPAAKIGKDVSIGTNVVIGPQVSIGNGTSIQHNVVIVGQVKIGSMCVIKSNAVIGEEGFGFEYSEFGVPEHFPHIGSIEIGNNVWVGAGSTIERAHIHKTIIKNNVKIDDLVQVGHNCVIGENSLITSGTVLCGAAVVGKNCWIAPNSSIKERVKIGDNVLVGLGAVVIKDVPAKTVVVGNPAKKLRDK